MTLSSSSRRTCSKPSKHRSHASATAPVQSDPILRFAQSDLFKGLPQRALASALEVARIERVPSRRIILRQGDRATRAWLLLEGRLRILQSGVDGEEFMLRFIEPGESFGSVPLFTGGRLPADAISVVPSIIASWSEADLRKLIDAFPTIALNLIALVGTRLAEAQTRLRELASHPAEQRLARALLRLATKFQSTDSHRIMLPILRKDLADMTGTTLPTVSRTLARWRRAGVLGPSRSRLAVADIRALMAIARKDGA